MAWTGPYPTWAVGQISQASDWNTYVAGNASWLAVRPSGRIYANSSTTTVSGTPITLLLGATDYLQGGMTTGTNTLVIPVTGVYLVSWSVGWGTVGAAGIDWAGYLNNSISGGIIRSHIDNVYVSGASIVINSCDHVLAQATSSFSVIAEQSSGSNEVTVGSGLYSYLSAVLLSGTTTTG